MSIYCNGKKYLEKKNDKEQVYEETIYNNHKLLFGEKTIYIPAKKKIESRDLGGTIPDGFLFDFSKPESVDFYLIEIELSKHSFFNHIFPQLTKFFAFFKNPRSQADLIEKIFTIVDSDPSLRTEFVEYVGTNELYKAIKDIIEDSQKILLIIDEKKPELPEIMNTYTDTWDKMVKVMIVKEYCDKNEVIFTTEPDFETIEIAESDLDNVEQVEIGEDKKEYTENFHLDGVESEVKDIYERIKISFPDVKFNPQRYYISMVDKRNFAYIKVRKKKIKIVLTMPISIVKQKIKHNEVAELSEAVQRFYNADCCAILIKEIRNIHEIIEILKENRVFKIIKKR